MLTWDDAQYLKFADQRTRPAHELLARVGADDARVHDVVDLGCGPGNSTALLLARWPGARIKGVDASPQMLATARRDLPQLTWQQADVADIASWLPEGGVDVLFANAVLQWLPDHERLFPALLRSVRPGGWLAVQMPQNHQEPSHRGMRELPGPWSVPLPALRPASPVHEATTYYDLLATDAMQLDLWQTTYSQVMADAAAIVEWVKGTGLRPYLEALADEAERSRYLSAYGAAIDAAYPPRADGRRLFPFPRLFIVAQRRG